MKKEKMLMRYVIESALAAFVIFTCINTAM